MYYATLQGSSKDRLRKKKDRKIVLLFLQSSSGKENYIGTKEYTSNGQINMLVTIQHSFLFNNNNIAFCPKQVGVGIQHSFLFKNAETKTIQVLVHHTDLAKCNKAVHTIQSSIRKYYCHFKL
jgi:hypothetical protein